MKYITVEESYTYAISKNFKLHEFLVSATALKYKIENKIPIAFIKRIKYLVDTVLQPLRDKFGRIKITSGWRIPELAPLVNSNKRSDHSHAQAVDFVSANGVPLKTMLKYIVLNMNYKSVIAEYLPYGWIHLAVQKGNNKKTNKVKTRKLNYVKMRKSEFLKHIA